MFRDVSSTYLKMVMNELVRFGMLNRTEERKGTFYEIICNRETQYILDGTEMK